MKRILTIMIACLLASPLAAQDIGQPNFPQILPAQTLVGRSANSPGPTEAIPFSSIAGMLSLGPIVGTTTNDNAAIGYVGEFLETDITAGHAVTLTTSTIANIATLSLTPGDWDVRGSIGFLPGASTTIAYVAGALTTVAGVMPDDTGKGGEMNDLSMNGNTTGGTPLTYALGTIRVSIAANTTVYIVANSSFGVSTLKAYGYLAARRIR